MDDDCGEMTPEECERERLFAPTDEEIAAIYAELDAERAAYPNRTPDPDAPL